MFNSEWYNSLNKPFLSPPDSIFMPVWTILYAMIFVSLILYLRGGLKGKSKGLVYFIIQLLFNFSWTFVFFGMKNIFLALLVISAMLIFLLLNIIEFYKHSKMAGNLLLPYLIWVLFAFYLNFSYFLLN